MPSAPILVFGRRGQVAQELARLGEEQGLSVQFAGRDELDLSSCDPETLIGALRPCAVINAAAYTAVDRAETEAAEAFALNRNAPMRMAESCAKREIPFVQFSTDYVFDGRAERAYVETDPRDPQSVYGRSKAEGEDAVVAAGGKYAILRTSWVVGGFGGNFVKTMLRLAETRPEISVVEDQIGRPTWSRSAALASLEAVRMLERDPRLTGVYHVAGEDDATWAALARGIFDRARTRGLPHAVVNGILTKTYPTPAVRPANSRLDSSRFATVTAWKPMSWGHVLDAIMSELDPNVEAGDIS